MKKINYVFFREVISQYLSAESDSICLYNWGSRSIILLYFCIPSDVITRKQVAFILFKIFRKKIIITNVHRRRCKYQFRLSNEFLIIISLCDFYNKLNIINPVYAGTYGLFVLWLLCIKIELFSEYHYYITRTS